MFRLSIAIVLAALALPAAALAKGPTEGTISGAGFVKTFKVSGDGSPGSLGGDLTQATGFFPAAFGQSPDPMLHRKPAVLGPSYTIVWTVPTGSGSPNRIRQRYRAWADCGITALHIDTSQAAAIELMADIAAAPGRASCAWREATIRSE